MSQSYLYDDREITIPRPKKNPGWIRVSGSEVTYQTQEALNKLGEFFPNVSFFGWHPNIPQAQYSDKADTWGSNYNKRLLIAGSVIVRSKPGNKSQNAVIDGWRTIRNALKHIPEVKTLGGSGDSDEDTASYQMQLSFLVGEVGTHEESDKIKNKIITHGAYSLYKGEWFYIPAHLFNPWIESKQKIEKRSDEIVNILKNHPLVTNMKEYKMESEKGDDGDKTYASSLRFSTTEKSLILKTHETHYNLFDDTWTTFRSLDENTNRDLKMLLEKIGGLKAKTIKQLVKNPSDYKEILHPYCGRVAARKFGF
jgi:hypothetical protein